MNIWTIAVGALGYQCNRKFSAIQNSVSAKKGLKVFYADMKIATNL